ncbi:hypothetical protein MBLNU459_g7314t1 [Dothideomycetes sp. NU459]
MDEFGFICVCQLCTNAPETCVDSAKRRLKLGRLEETVGDGISIMTSPNRVLGYCRRILELLSAEGEYDTKVHGVYYDAFQICVAHSDYPHAAAFVALAIEVKRFCQGDDSDGMEEMQDFMRAPEKHRLDRMTKEWSSWARHRRAENSEGFETWLWSKAS